MRYEQTFEKPGNCLDFWISWLFNRIRLGNLQFEIYTATYKDRGSRKVFGHIHLASQSRASGKGVDRIGTACFCFARCYPATFALPLSALESWTTAIPKAPHDKIDSDLLVERCLWTTSPCWTLYSEYPDLDNCLFEEETLKKRYLEWEFRMYRLFLSRYRRFELWRLVIGHSKAKRWCPLWRSRSRIQFVRAIWWNGIPENETTRY